MVESGDDDPNAVDAATWVVLSLSRRRLRMLAILAGTGWSAEPPDEPVLWTDSFSNLLEVLEW